MIRKLKYIVTHSVVNVLLTSIAVYGYVNSLLLYLKGEYYNTYQLEEGIFIGTLYLIIYLFISTIFLKSIINNKWLKIGATLLYAYALYEMFSNIAFSMLADLSGGGTFTPSEVISTFVLGYKETVVLIGMATIVYYLFLRLLPLNKYKAS